MPSYQLFRNDNDEFLFLKMCLQSAIALQEPVVNDLAMTLCDKQAFSADDISFMQALTLENMTFGLADGAKFSIQNSTNNTSMLFSDRDSDHGEIRGAVVLKQKLLELKKVHPEMTLYDGLQYITSGKDSDFYIKFRAGVAHFAIDATTDDKFEVNANNAEQFLDTLIGLIKNKELSFTDFEPSSEEETALHDIFTKVFLRFKQFERNFGNKLELLETKIADLQKRGETVALGVATTLKDALVKSAVKFFNSADNSLSFEQKLSTFKTECSTAIDSAKPVLETHRGWKQYFADFSFLLVSALTLGIANLVSKKVNGTYGFFNTKTESTKIVNDIELVIGPVSK